MKEHIALLYKSFLISFTLYILHFLFYYVLSAYTFKEVLGGFIYLAMYFWVYFFIVYLYVLVSSKIKSKNNRACIILVFTAIGYLLSRTGDIIDGDFFSNFEIVNSFIFMFIGLILFYLTERYVIRAHILTENS